MLIHVRLLVVVIIRETDIFTPGDFQSMIPALTDMKVVIISDNLNPTVLCGKLLAHLIATIRRTVCDKENLYLLQSLTGQGRKTRPKQFAGIVNGDNGKRSISRPHPL